MGQSHEARELDTLQFHELTAADVMGRVIQSAYQRTKGDVLASMMIEGFGVVCRLLMTAIGSSGL